MWRAFGKSGVGAPSRSTVFQPVWSKCRCVNATMSISSGGTPASSSNAGSAGSTPSGASTGRPPMPVSTRIVRPALRISHGVMLTDSSSASVSRSRYGSSDAPAASGKKSVSFGRSHVSCSATNSTFPTDARCTLLIATLPRPSCRPAPRA